MEDSIAAAEGKVLSVLAALDDAAARLAQLQQGVKKAHVDLKQPKLLWQRRLPSAKRMQLLMCRSLGDLKTNLAAVGNAVAAWEKGLAGAFLQ